MCNDYIVEADGGVDGDGGDGSGSNTIDAMIKQMKHSKGSLLLYCIRLSTLMACTS